MNKEWSQLNKEIKILLNKKSSFKDGINKLIELRTLLYKEWECAMKDLSIEDYSAQPFKNKDGYESKTIAYSIFHVFRIEDIILNTLINNRQQIFIRDNYQNKTNSMNNTIGNELIRESISSFSKTLIIIGELWKYAKKVFEESNEWLLSIEYDDLKIEYSELDEERIKDTNTVAKRENWLIEYWCRKDIKGLLGMPFSRHWIMHLEASLRIRNKLIKQIPIYRGGTNINMKSKKINIIVLSIFIIFLFLSIFFYIALVATGQDLFLILGSVCAVLMIGTPYLLAKCIKIDILRELEEKEKRTSQQELIYKFLKGECGHFMSLDEYDVETEIYIDFANIGYIKKEYDRDPYYVIYI